MGNRYLEVLIKDIDVNMDYLKELKIDIDDFLSDASCVDRFEMEAPIETLVATRNSLNELNQCLQKLKDFAMEMVENE